MANEELLIHIGADTGDFDQGVQKANKGIGGLVGGVVGLVSPLGLAAAGVGLLGGALTAAANEAVGIERLNQTLQNSIPGWAGNTEAIDAYISKQEQLAFADDQLRDSLGFLVGQTKDLEEAQMLQAVAMDLARAKGIDLEAATKAVGKVDQESIGILKKLGIEVTEQMTKEEALTAIRANSAGQAEAYANTAAGSMERIQNMLGNVVEDIGGVLLPIVTDALSGILSLADGLMTFLGPAFQMIGEAITATMNFLNPLITTFQTLFDDLKAGKDPIDAIIAFLGNLGQTLMDLGGKVLQAIVDALPGIIAKLGEWGKAFIDWIGPRIIPMLGALAGLLLELGKWLITVALPEIIKKLAEWGGAFLGWIAKDVLPFIGAKLGEFASKIWEWITQTARDIVQKAANIGKNLIDGIVQGLRNAGQAVINFLIDLAKRALAAVLDFFQPGSPSKVMMEVGEQIGMGLAVGIQNSTGAVVSAMHGLSTAAMGGMGGPGLPTIGGASPRLGRGGAGGVNLNAVFVVDGERIPVRIDRISNGLAMDQVGYRRLPTGWSAT